MERMPRSQRSGWQEDAPAMARGALEGMLAGVLLALVEMGVAVARGQPPLTPWSLSASAVMGPEAVAGAAPATLLLLGSAVHLALAAFFGVQFGLVARPLARDAQVTTAHHLVAGMLWGALLWVVNFQVIARLHYPWFLDRPQLVQLLVHMLAFGLPLGLLHAMRTRPRHPHRVRGPQAA